MKKMCAVILSVGALALAAATAGADFRVPLDLRPNGGKAGMRFVSNGVPLLAGQAREADELHVMGPGGKEVPAQFRVLARWWRQDKSLRWVLVDFERTEAEEANPIYTLVGTARRTPLPKTQLKVSEDANFIRVNTGPALFEISKKRFNLFNRVALDQDGDGEFGQEETVVHPDSRLGSVVEDPEGRKYYSSAGTTSVKVLESGPVAVKILAQGMHVSEEEGAFRPGLYGYEIFMTFHAGQTYCNLDAILTNNSAKPIGEPHFEDWSLLTRMGKGSAGWQFRPGPGVAIVGKADESALLYQDSVGTEHWKENTGIMVSGDPKPPPPDLATFRGYKLWRVSGGEHAEIAHGDFADGVGACQIGSWGCTVSPRYFWQQFPSALQFGGDGVVRMSPFPREYKEVHWLEDASAKAQEFQLCFYRATAGAGEAARQGAREYQTRVFALPSPEHCGAAGALSDLGPYVTHEKVASFAKEDKEVNIEAMQEGFLHPNGNGYGWQVFGMRWFELAGHSPWNYEPLATSGSLWTHLFNRNDDRLEWGMRVARHARDVRAYHIEGQDNLAVWTTWQPGYWENCVIEHFSRLVHGATAQTEYEQPRFSKHPYPRARWELPNMDHLNLDEVYDLYLLTGDDRAFRSMRTIADHGAIWSTMRPGPRQVSRAYGWCLRALSRYYELTGDRRYEPYVRQAVDQLWRDVNKAGTVGTGTWQLAIYARGAATAYLATDDERMRDLAIGCAEWAMAYDVNPEHGHAYQQFDDPWNHKPEDRGKVLPEEYKDYWFPAWANGYMIDLYAFAYRHTGDRKYLEAMEFAWEKNADYWWLGYFPSAMYMAYGPRPDRTPPAAVSDLAGKAGKASATLTWTAPGDDHNAGTARAYQIKYATKPILDFVPWPEKMETHITFWGSENVEEEPVPKAAGTRQSLTVEGLSPGTHYFAMRSRDECGNQSAMSNVVSVEIGS